MNPKVSIILPIYNVENYLPMCLESIIHQTYKNIEIICVNDGSTDNSVSVAEKYAKFDTRIRVINQPNRGVSATRNQGLRDSTGEYIFFIDPDDFINPETVESCVSKIKETDSDIVLYDVINVYRDSKIEVKRVGNFLKKYNIDTLYYSDNKNIIYQNGSPWSKMYKKEFLLKNNLFFNEQIRFSEDSIYWIQLLRYNPKIALLDKCLYFYRKERINAASSHTFDLIDRLWDVYNNNLLKLENENTSEEDVLYALDYHTRLAIFMYSTCSNIKMLKHYEKSLKYFNDAYKNFKRVSMKKFIGYRLLKIRVPYLIVKRLVMFFMKKKLNNKMVLIEDGLSIVQQRGCGQYTLRIFDCLKDKYDVTMKRKYLLENIQNNIIRRIAYILWLNTVFVLQTLFLKKGTICLFTSFLTPIIKFPHIKYYSVLHDTGANDNPEFSTKTQLMYGLFANWSAVHCSDKIITVSETTKNNILKYYKIKPEKISIVYNTPSLQSVDYDVKETILTKHNIKSKSYIFFVGGISKNKNVKSLIEAFNKIANLYPNLELIIAGNKGNDNTKFVTNDRIKFVGFISNEDVKVLYKNALLFVFPSLYEGFGIPIIDAQMMGVPVICTDMDIFREVANDAAIFVEPDGNSIATAIAGILNDKSMYENLVQKGFENFKRFEFNKLQNQIVGVIEEKC